MSENSHKPNPLQPLTIGNIVNVGLQIYRANFKFYSQLALTAHLWLFIPIYGWAKFYGISALISRLAFGSLTNQPETIKAAQDKTNHSLWKLLILGILVFLMPLTFACLWLILFSFIFGIIYAILSVIWGITLPQPPKNGNLFETWQSAVIWLPIAIAVYSSPLWHYSRLFITELTLVMEEKSNPFKAIKQSWELTKGLRIRLMTIIIVSFAITFPVWIIVWRGFGAIFRLISQNFLRYLIESPSIRAILLTIILSIITGVILMPFWQSIKAVTYYDIRCRRESLDLELRNWE